MEKSKKKFFKILRICNLPTINRPGQGKAALELSESKYFNTIIFTPFINKKVDSYVQIKNLNHFYFPNFIFPKKSKKILKIFFSIRRIISITIEKINLIFNKKIYFNDLVHIHHIFYFLPALILKI